MVAWVSVASPRCCWPSKAQSTRAKCRTCRSCSPTGAPSHDCGRGRVALVFLNSRVWMVWKSTGRLLLELWTLPHLPRVSSASFFPSHSNSPMSPGVNGGCIDSCENNGAPILHTHTHTLSLSLTWGSRCGVWMHVVSVTYSISLCLVMEAIINYPHL